MTQIEDIEKTEAERERQEPDIQHLLFLDKAIGRHTMVRKVLPLLLIMLAATLFALFILPHIDTSTRGSSTALAVFIGAGLLSLLLTSLSDAKISDIEASRSLILARRRVQEQLSSPPKKPGIADEDLESTEDTYFDNLVKINVENLAAYYELVKVQTDKSFRASLSIAYFGGALIIVGLALGFYRADGADKVSYIAAGSGVLTEFIAGVFFWLYSKTVSQLRGYHDSLISVQNILLSFKLVSDTRDPKEKAQLVSRMCSYLLSGLPQVIMATDGDN